MWLQVQMGRGSWDVHTCILRGQLQLQRHIITQLQSQVWLQVRQMRCSRLGCAHVRLQSALPLVDRVLMCMPSQAGMAA